MRVKLSLPTDNDYELMHEWRNHPRIRLASRSAEFITYEEHQIWLKKVMFDPLVCLFMFCVGKNRVGVGRLDIHGVHAEFSIYLNPEYIGKGLGLLCMKELLRFSFSRQGLVTIYGETFATNISARKTFEKAGLELLQQEGDTKFVSYGISKKTWIRNN